MGFMYAHKFLRYSWILYCLYVLYYAYQLHSLLTFGTSRQKQAMGTMFNLHVNYRIICYFLYTFFIERFLMSLEIMNLVVDTCEND